MAQPSVLRHVVMFGFKDGTTREQIDRVTAGFAALPAKVPGIRDFEWGTNTSPEDLNHGLTHCFLMTFDSAAARDAYLPHPDHQAFVDLIGPVVDKITVVDYWTQG